MTDLQMFPIYEYQGEYIATLHDTDSDRSLASHVLAGTRADAEAAQPTGTWINSDSLTPAEHDHLQRHGWTTHNL